MRANVKKWGNSTAVRSPASVLEAARFRVDDTVDVRAEDGKIVIELIREQGCDLDQLLDRITPENLHEPMEFGVGVASAIGEAGGAFQDIAPRRKIAIVPAIAGRRLASRLPTFHPSANEWKEVPS